MRPPARETKGENQSGAEWRGAKSREGASGAKRRDPACEWGGEALSVHVERRSGARLRRAVTQLLYLRASSRSGVTRNGQSALRGADDGAAL
jgi:hypothetical protein